MNGKSVGGVRDQLRVKVEYDCELGEECPARQCRNGGVHQRVLREGDTIRLCKDPNRVHAVTAVTTDYGPHLGRFSIRGEHRQLAAAMLVLDNGATKYVDDDVEKICPECASTVIAFGI